MHVDVQSYPLIEIEIYGKKELFRALALPSSILRCEASRVPYSTLIGASLDKSELSWAQRVTTLHPSEIRVLADKLFDLLAAGDIGVSLPDSLGYVDIYALNLNGLKWVYQYRWDRA